MIHVGALPGTAYNTKTLSAIIGRAVEEAAMLEKAGVDAVMIENMHDRPYLLRRVGPEIVAAMTAVGAAVRQTVRIPVVVGSGVTADNLADYWSVADAFIVGSYFKRDGIWSNPPDPRRLERFIKAVEALPARGG